MGQIKVPNFNNFTTISSAVLVFSSAALIFKTKLVSIRLIIFHFISPSESYYY